MSNQFDSSNPYLSLYTPKIAEVILKYENDFREKVSTNIYVDNKFYFEKLILDVKQAYIEEGLTEAQFAYQLEEIIINFKERNEKYLLDNFCNDLTDIIPIELEEFEAVPTQEDYNILNNSDNLENDEENNEKSDIDAFFAILNSMGRFLNKEQLNLKNLVIYIVKLHILRKKIIKELSSNPEDKKLLIELNIHKLDDKYITTQIFKTVESDKDIEILTKNNTFYLLKYFKE